ncbi:hypothetical protein EZ456_08755 [Pedobacter psychrodurus]|uniref:Uncharacterized protein n=1 Tax=Pedobacter psychrodurus TaxID=2530456 RepID=A0A4R0Q3A6_9SPHI|nr:hypothetical protein [Pedobacter psychrodurus]TCD27282.1 hypothetical protein EZ456_08755 [Pedobacter psychrodurus]
MKNLISILYFCIIISVACKAQKPVAKINSNQVKTSNVTYDIKKPTDTYTEIINSNNKLTAIKPLSPNLPKDISVVQNMKFSRKQLTQICANIIPLNTLKDLPVGYGDWLSIRFKVSSMGEPLEMEFLIRNTSLVTAEEIQKIEKAIKNSTFKFTFTNGIERFFGGVNYFNIDVPIRYIDMLKAKQNN